MDPRIRRTREAVLNTTLAHLAAHGFGDFTIEGVAAESGVAKSTIYRHWPTKLVLLRDALEELNVQPDVELPSVPVREQAERLLQHLTAALYRSAIGACLPALIEASERYSEIADLLHRYSARRRSRLVSVLQSGIRNGELSKHLDPELAAAALSGPIFYKRLMTDEPIQPSSIRQLIYMVLGPE